jgi:phosphate transport system protein
MMTEQHLSSQFNSDLNTISSRLLSMGGFVETQIQRAMSLLARYSTQQYEEILQVEEEVDRLEVEIDQLLTSIVARRQPAACDLRLLLAIAKITTNLERAGDEVQKIAKRICSIVESDDSHLLIAGVPMGDLRQTFIMADNLMRRALDAFARLDIAEAVSIVREDDQIDHEFKGFARKLATYMMEDPHTIGASLDLLFIAKAVERVGDHAKNIAEFIIYIVKGTDVRHSTLAKIESLVVE